MAIFELFPEAINPQLGYRIRFDVENRAMDYLDHFKIINKLKCKFIPLDLTFPSYNNLTEFLFDKGILYWEVKSFHYTNVISSNRPETIPEGANKLHIDRYIVVDTIKIYDVEDSISKYLLNFKYYTVNQVADMLSMSRPTVYKVVNDKTLKSVRINGQIRINHLDLANFINRENQ